MRIERVQGEPSLGKIDGLHISYIMKELKQVYGRFESVHFNRGRELTKVTHSSLDKHAQSPYLQR